MATPSDIEVSRTVEYRLSVDYQLQQQPGVLRPLVGGTGSYSDKKVQIEDQFDALVAREKTTRNGDTQNDDMSLVRRWLVKPRTQLVAPLIDRDDMASTKLDIKSPAAVQTAKAIRCGQDDRWLQGFYGTNYTGEEGATATTFKSTNIMAVDYEEAGPSGITLNKLIGMRKLMKQRKVNLQAEKPFCIYTAEQLEDLLKISQIQSKDYNPSAYKAMENGEVTSFMGFDFIPVELDDSTAFPLSSAADLTVDGSGYRRIPFGVRSGMHWGSWTEFFGKVTERDDKQFSTQIYGETCGAATRTNEDKCFQMLCDES